MLACSLADSVHKRIPLGEKVREEREVVGIGGVPAGATFRSSTRTTACTCVSADVELRTPGPGAAASDTAARVYPTDYRVASGFHIFRPSEFSPRIDRSENSTNVALAGQLPDWGMFEQYIVLENTAPL